MNRIRIRNNHFIRNGKPFFYQGDTLWMAFSKLSLDEWREIMQARRAQRFTVAQISVLPISHDNAPDDADLHPFALADGKYDFDRINDAYFDHAEQMLAEALRQDIVPCLHMLWANYVPDTWAARIRPDTVMTWPQTEHFLRYAIARFEKYAPIYSVSGDTHFETPRMVDVYRKSIALLRELAPQALLTMHLAPGANPPPDFNLDFYSYQAGHNIQDQDNNFLLARQFLSRNDGKPIVNSEPPYDGHSHGFRYGRFQTFDIRKAFWQSLLSGASAGVGYGAHGMWMMYRDGQPFNNTAFSGKPFHWRTALSLEGAWEGAFAQMLFDRYNLYGMLPLDCLKEMPPQICAAETSDKTVLIYAPWSCDIATTLDAASYEIDAFDLEHKRFMKPAAVHADGGMILLMPQCNADVLYVLTPK